MLPSHALIKRKPNSCQRKRTEQNFPSAFMMAFFSILITSRGPSHRRDDAKYRTKMKKDVFAPRGFYNSSGRNGAMSASRTRERFLITEVCISTFFPHRLKDR